MIGPKEKKERALGEHLHLKGERCQTPKCALVRRPYKPGVHGPTGRRKAPSDFGRQLAEKQKFRVSYGLHDRNLAIFFRNAQKQHGDVAQTMLSLIERRLDNVIFRLGFAGSRGMARQLVTHGHIMVNKRRVRSPGFQVSVNDVISVYPSSATKRNLGTLKETLQEHDLPAWLSRDLEKLEGTMLALPSEITLPFDINLLVESFSK